MEVRRRPPESPTPQKLLDPPHATLCKAVGEIGTLPMQGANETNTLGVGSTQSLDAPSHVLRAADESGSSHDLTIQSNLFYSPLDIHSLLTALRPTACFPAGDKTTSCSPDQHLNLSSAMPPKRKGSTVEKDSTRKSPRNHPGTAEPVHTAELPEQQTTMFFHLPREIRDMIYNLAVVHSTTRIAVTAVIKSPGDHMHLSMRDKEPPLLTTCQLIRDEARPIYYNKNKHAALIGHMKFGPLCAWLTMIGPHATSKFGKLEMWFVGPDTTWTKPANLSMFLQVRVELQFVGKIYLRGVYQQQKVYKIAM